MQARVYKYCISIGMALGRLILDRDSLRVAECCIANTIFVFCFVYNVIPSMARIALSSKVLRTTALL